MDPQVILLLIYGVISGITGLITAYASLKTNKDKDVKELQEKLEEARREAEEAHAELHKLRMKE